MILTDLFGEDVATNIRVLYMPSVDKINDISGHIGSGSKDFSMIDICFLSVGQYCPLALMLTYTNLL